MTGLLAFDYTIILDGAFFLILVLGLIIGIWKGFVKQITKIAGWIFSIVVALFFCVALSNQIDKWWGLATKLGELVHNVKVGGWLSIGICFVGLVIVVRLVAWLLGWIGTKLCEASKFLGALNKIFGGIWGLFIAALIIALGLAICVWINKANVNDFINSSHVVKYIYNWKWFRNILTLLPGMIKLP